MHREEGLRLGGIDHDQVDQHAGHLDLLRRQRAAQRHALDLCDDEAAGAARGLRHRDHLAEDGFVLHGDVAVLVRGGAADERNVDVERLEEQVVLAVDLHEFDQIVRGLQALPPAVEARIDEGAEADMRDEAGAAGGHLARQLRQTALRQRVGLDLVGGGHALDRRRVDQGAADDALEQAGMGEMADAAIGAVAEADRMHGGEIAWAPFRLEALADGADQGVRHGVAGAGAADQQRVAVGDQLRELLGGDDARRHDQAATPQVRITSVRRDAARSGSRMRPAASASLNASIRCSSERALCWPPTMTKCFWWPLR